MRLFFKLFLLSVVFCSIQYVMAAGDLLGMDGIKEMAEILGMKVEKPHEIFEAVEQNDVKKVKRILLEDKDLVHVKELSGETPLYRSRTVEMTKLLLDYGAVVNKKTSDGRTPLHAVSFNGDAKVVKFFLDHGAGADIHARVEGMDGGTPLHIAGSAEVAKVLLAYGADPNARTVNSLSIIDMGGIVPLNFAIIRGKFEIARVLLDHGAGVNAIMRNGETLLYYFIRTWDMGEILEYNQEKAVLFLVKNGAKMNTETLNQEATVLALGEKVSKGKPGEVSLEYMEVVRQLVKNEVSRDLSEGVLKNLNTRISEERQKGVGGAGGACPKSFE